MRHQLICISTLFIASTFLVAAPQATQPATRPATQPAPPDSAKKRQDPRAVALAERVLKRVGGEKAWNDTHYLSWNFFGARTHVWDRQSMRDRIDYTDESGDAHTLIVDLDTKTGKAWIGGKPVTDPDTLAQLMEQAHAMWVNDSYWLAMPFKLFDPGVNLRHAGDRTLEDGTETEVLVLTFDDGAGLAPQNKYDVFVDTRTDLVVQWDYYRSAAQRAPTISTPWKGWKQYGDLWFSTDRGELRGNPAKITGVAVYDEMPETAFTEPQKPQLPDK